MYMADKVSILKTIKLLLGMAEEVPASPSYTLEDGTPIEVSALEVGGSVIVGDAPAPVGDHKLSDGTIITVDEMGIIVSVLPADVLPVVPTDEPVLADADPIPPSDDVPANIETMIDAAVKEAVKEAVGEAMGKYTTKMAAQEKALKTSVLLMEELMKTVSVDTPKPDQTFSKPPAVTRAEKFSKLNEIVKNLNK